LALAIGCCCWPTVTAPAGGLPVAAAGPPLGGDEDRVRPNPLENLDANVNDEVDDDDELDE
jgi:hypothetical protein